MKVSFIATVLNEGQTIRAFLNSIFSQSKIPDEVIIVDGGSTDGTLDIISGYKVRLISKKGNRSIGRNEAIRNSKNEIIVCTDSGCILDKDWVKNIVKPFSNPATDVVAGYYKGIPKTVFEKSLIPYVLVMPDKVNPKTFLPASRSMAFKKSIWEKAGGFPEKFNNNEDYVFAQRLRKINANIVFENKAVVNWIPRNNLRDAFGMFFRFSLGDGESGILRDKVILLFARYMLVFYFILLTFIERSKSPLYLLGIGFVVYIIWSINKNYKYVNDRRAFYYLPALQFTSDIAVISGSIVGFIKAIRFDKVLWSIKKNKGTVLVIGMYIAAMLAVINWGIPNLNHPFTYHMDEWHQSQSVRNLFKFGTVNMAGSANGSVFQFFLTGLYLIPFYLFKIVDIFAIKSSISNLNLQHVLFIVLRLNTLIFGCLSIITVSYIGKKYFKINPFITAFLFTINPVWIMLGNYYKYDIALIFWILVSLLFLLRYARSLSLTDFILAAFFSGLSISTKLSAIPLLAVLITSYVVLNEKFYKKIKLLLTGLLAYLLTFFLFGIPDIILGKGNMIEYLSSNLISSPQLSSNYKLGTNYFIYLLLKLFPITFGDLFYYLFFVSLIFLILKTIINLYRRSFVDNSRIILLISFVFFFLSLIPLGIGASGNRVLVLLPFMAIIAGIFISSIKIKGNLVIRFFLVLFILSVIFLQSAQTYIWLKLKTDSDIRVDSSKWITENIKSNSLIGLENIPIYQKIPDLLLKEFYLIQYGQSNNTTYKYTVIDSKSKNLPKVLILTDMDVEYKYLIKSDKNNLTNRLINAGYRKVKVFEPNLKYYYLTGDQLSFYLSGLIPIPTSIAVYQKIY